MSPFFHRGSSLWLVLAMSGCALLGKSDALSPRYFSPDTATARSEAPSASQSERSTAPELRLGRVTAASYLGERIVFRNSNYELSFYEERRWTEQPDQYLRRALAQSFFEQHGVRRIVSGSGSTLEVELTEFAEIRTASPLARVQATYMLSENRLVRREATITVEVPIDTKDATSPEIAVRAMADALGRAVKQIVDQVLVELRTPMPEDSRSQLSTASDPGSPKAGLDPNAPASPALPTRPSQ